MDLNRTSVQFCAGNLYLRREICLFAEKFIRFLVNKYGKHIVYTDGGSWYPETCNVLGLKHYIHSSKEKSLIERVNQYFKDRTECFDDYYPCTKNSIKCDLSHGDNWIKLFIYLHNTKIRKTIIFNIACEIALT